jgi:hypothetical protein
MEAAPSELLALHLSEGRVRNEESGRRLPDDDIAQLIGPGTESRIIAGFLYD